MSEFTPITTQEQFDAAIGARIQREREALTKKYGDYDDIKAKNAEYEKQLGEMSKNMEDAAKKYAGYDKQLEELNGKVKGYETSSVKMRIAHETGLPYELANRLSGDDEAAIRKDAETLAGLVSAGKPIAAPLASTEPAGGETNTKAALKGALQTLRGE